MSDGALLLDPRLGFGRVIRQTFGLIGRNPASVIGLCVMVSAADLAVSHWLQSVSSGLDRTAGLVVKYGIGAFVGMLFQTFTLTCLTSLAVESLGARRASLAAALRVGLRLLAPAYALYVVTYLGMVLGLALLVIPGLFLIPRWMAAVPARVMEAPSLRAALTRSADLTAGNRWVILGLAMAYAVVPFAFGLLNALVLLRPSLPSSYVASSVWALFWHTVSLLIGSAGMVAIYIELRRLGEGALPGQLAAVFE